MAVCYISHYPLVIPLLESLGSCLSITLSSSSPIRRLFIARISACAHSTGHLAVPFRKALPSPSRRHPPCSTSLAPRLVIPRHLW